MYQINFSTPSATGVYSNLQIQRHTVLSTKLTKPETPKMAGKKSIAEWEAVFRAADKDGSGTLDVHELRDMLRRANCNITDSQIGDAFVYLHGPHGDRITLEEFVKGMQKLEEFIKRLVQLFNQYDADKSGYLDKNELRKIMESSGHKFTEQEIQDILRKADKSGDGKISFDEFFDACT